MRRKLAILTKGAIFGAMLAGIAAAIGNVIGGTVTGVVATIITGAVLGAIIDWAYETRLRPPDRDLDPGWMHQGSRRPPPGDHKEAAARGSAGTRQTRERSEIATLARRESRLLWT
jgi:hypothetical protein